MRVGRVALGVIIIIVGIGMVVVFTAMPMFWLFWGIPFAIISFGASLIGWPRLRKEKPEQGTMPKGWKQKDDSQEARSE
jgi:hypothetical protein